MKLLILTLFVAVATAAPIDDSNGPVELIVNGVPEGQPIDLSHIVDIKLNEHVNGQIASATNMLHPYTAVGIAEAAAAAGTAAPEPVVLPAPAQPEVVLPEAVVLPAPVLPEVVLPEPVILPAPAAPEVVSHVVPEPVILPAPAAPEVVSPVVPEPVILPAPAAPEVVSPIAPEPVILPAPAAPEVVSPVIPEPVILPTPVHPEVVEPAPATGEIFNDGTVSVTLNAPQEAGVFNTIQSWFSMVLNYFNNGVLTSQQIV